MVQTIALGKQAVVCSVGHKKEKPTSAEMGCFDEHNHLKEKEGRRKSNVLVERILDEATQTVVSKCAMYKQQPFQESASVMRCVRHEHDCLERAWPQGLHQPSPLA